jgi:hypothetical protein
VPLGLWCTVGGPQAALVAQARMSWTIGTPNNPLGCSLALAGPHFLALDLGRGSAAS